MTEGRGECQRCVVLSNRIGDAQRAVPVAFPDDSVCSFSRVTLTQLLAPAPRE